MAGSLEGVLARVPGLGGYVAGQQMGNQDESRQLAQMGELQGILSRRQAMQQKQEIRGILSKVAQEAGGDPAKMGPMLLQTGQPELMKLGQQMMPKAAEPYTLGPDQTRYDPTGKAIAYGTPKDKVTWSDPYQMGGAWVQKSSDGQVRQAVAREPNVTIKNPPAPSVKDIVDPLDPKRMIAVDTRVFNETAYRGGNRAGVIGTSGREPSYAKREDEKQAGSQNLKDTVSMLNDAYAELERTKTGVSPSQGTVKNIYERAAASGLGQTVAGAVGTQAQTERDKIAMARANMMAALKQATGMSAQALNSNAELMFYLQSATDPSKSREANKDALAYMDRRFKLGLGLKPTGALKNPYSSGTVAPAAPPPPEGFKPL